MKVLLVGAICIAVFGFIGGVINGDGQKAGEAVVAGGSLFILLATISVAIALVKFLYGKLK